MAMRKGGGGKSKEGQRLDLDATLRAYLRQFAQFSGLFDFDL